MSYAELYKFCQGLDVPISRKHLIPKVCELTRIERPRIMVSGMDPQILLGFILFPGEASAHPYAGFLAGRPLIVVGRQIHSDAQLNAFWQRLVVIKELMHYFDQGIEKITTSDDFEGVVSEFNFPLLERSPGMDSEVRGLWMALGVICPEELRQNLQRKLESGETSYEQIGALLRIPSAYVPHLFDPGFKKVIADLLAC